MRTKRNEEPGKEEEGTPSRSQTNNRQRGPWVKKQLEKRAKEREWQERSKYPNRKQKPYTGETNCITERSG